MIIRTRKFVILQISESSAFNPLLARIESVFDQSDATIVIQNFRYKGRSSVPPERSRGYEILVESSALQRAGSRFESRLAAASCAMSRSMSLGSRLDTSEETSFVPHLPRR